MTSAPHILFYSSLGIAFIHTLFGPDHTLPFVFLARARQWKMATTWWIVFLCGLGHVGSSIILGIIGLAIGISLDSLVHVEALRGSLAAYLLVIFGVLYAVWGIKRAVSGKPHTHIHTHGNLTHEHTHTHEEGHVHPHDDEKNPSVTPWILFIIFVFGPCEPLIPLFIYPAAQHDWGTVLAVSIGFSVVTIATMLTLVTLLLKGVNLLPLEKLERWTHALAGGLIAATGGSLILLGL